MRLLYTVLIRLYGAAIWVASLFSKKARSWVSGRRSWRFHMAKVLAEPAEKTMWMHAASLGEFEQGRPVLEAYRKRFPSHRIVLTFFSPSGYEVRKSYSQADLVSYLPLDTPANARDFLDLVAPDLVIFIKYEFWFNQLKVLKERGVKTYLVSGRFYESQSFFKSWGGFFRNGLSSFTHFAVQNVKSSDLLHSIGFENVMITGDTRFDRVVQVVKEDGRVPMIEKFISDSPILVIGSSWPYEEILLSAFVAEYPNSGYKYIIAPHEMDEKRMSEMEGELQLNGLKTARLSGGEGLLEEADVLFIDRIGILPVIYRYAQVAMLGGGFGNGIHNVLEPAAWAKPVIYGPRYEMFQEAVDLINLGGAIGLEGQENFNSTLRSLMDDKTKAGDMGQKAQKYCQDNAGATEKVMKLI